LQILTAVFETIIIKTKELAGENAKLPGVKELPVYTEYDDGYFYL
jgi:hypothetical protein